MFWGCFHGNIKGPGIFWKKDWGTIKEQSYREKIVPVIQRWIRFNAVEYDQQLTFIQDSAPAHAAKGTIEDLQERRIVCLQWPAYSPDLNPIEMVWNRMKDWIQEQFDDKLYSYDALRVAITAAWEAIDERYLTELLESMPQRCQAVIAADGNHTRY
jgi:DDE superfamily endonuclease